MKVLHLKETIERWPSGRRRTTGTRVWGNSSRVRIPSSLPVCPQIPTNSHFQEILDFKKNRCATFVQLSSNKYLQRRNNIYYFCKKINNKVVKISLKSNNLEYCRKLRNKILERLVMQKQEETIEIILQKLQEKQEHCIKLQDEINLLQEEKEIKKEKLQEIQTLIMRGKNVKEKKELLIKTLNLAQENKTLKKDYQHEAAINQLSQKMDFLLKTNELKFINFETLYNEFLEKKKADDDVGIESYQSYQSTFNFTKNFFENKNLNELLKKIKLNFNCVYIRTRMYYGVWYV